MADTLTADGNTSAANLSDGDRLPWLEAVEDEDDKGGPSAAKLIASLIVGLIALAAIIFAFFSFGNSSEGTTGAPEVIVADEGAYKTRPDDPGGMKVEGKGGTAFQASEGADPDGRIDLDAIPEQPVAGARGIAPAEQLKTRPNAPRAEPVIAPTPSVDPVRTPPAATPIVATPPAASGNAVQLGAFSSNASAQAAWKSMSGRFASLKPLTNSVVTATVGGKTVYRLRANVASPADAKTLCGKLKVAGESCAIIG